MAANVKGKAQSCAGWQPTCKERQCHDGQGKGYELHWLAERWACKIMSADANNSGCKRQHANDAADRSTHLNVDVEAEPVGVVPRPRRQALQRPRLVGVET